MDIDTNGFALGDVARDSITGYEGIIVAFTQWTTGCARVQLQSRVDKEGKVPESYGSDVLSLELVKAGPRHAIDTTKGGPPPAPTRVGDPRPPR